MVTTRYTSSLNTITHMIAEANTYTWIIYAVNASGVIRVQKVQSTSLDQIVFDVSITATSVVDVSLSTSYLHLLFDNANPTVMGMSLSRTAPNTTQYSYTREADIVEEPVGVAFSSNDSNINFLLPGSSSATNAKVYRYALTGAFNEVVAVRTSDIHIVDARAITVDTNNDLWIVTHTTPVKLIRMYLQSGGWRFSFTNIGIE